MKKTLCLLVAALFAIMSISSLAESAIDISGMSNEELLDLKNQIVDTLFARDQLIPIAPGTYLAGRDIAPGSYIITFLNSDQKSSGYDVNVYVSATAREQYSSDYSTYRQQKKLVEEALKENPSAEITLPVEPDESLYFVSQRAGYGGSGEQVRFTLEEGQLLYLGYHADEFSAVIEKAQALFMDT